MNDELCRLFDASVTADPAVRRPAEKRLGELRCVAGVPAAVLQIAAAAEAGELLRQVASTYLKNVVRVYWSEEEEAGLKAQDKRVLRENILGIIPGAPRGVRAQLTEAVKLIAQDDYPEEWPSLVPSLRALVAAAWSKSDPSVAHLLALLHSVTEKYRAWDRNDLVRSQVDELKAVIADVGPLLLTIMEAATAQLAGINGAALEVMLRTLQNCTEVYQDLVYVDLEKYMEDNLAKFMSVFLKLLQYDNEQLRKTGGVEEPGPLEEMWSAVIEVLTHFLVQLDSDLTDYHHEFVRCIWGMVCKCSQEPRYDQVTIASMEFLAGTARSIHHGVFQDEKTLWEVCEQVIIPNIQMQEKDLELFEFSPEEYVRKDIEGSDMHTRRRSACELTQALCKNYKEKVTALFQQQVAKLLEQNKQTGDWRAKDSAIYLITALSMQQSVSGVLAAGVSSVPLVDVTQFLNGHIVPELQAADVQTPRQPVIKADAIKYVSTFRKQIPPEQYPTCIELIAKWLLCEADVVSTYAAATIERLLNQRHEGKLCVEKKGVQHLTQQLFTSLFTVLQRSDRENEYLMLALMRVIRTLEELVGPFITEILSPLTHILGKVMKNPANPAYNHYLFESISALVKFNPPEVGAIERVVFEPFALILKNDVIEFIPYVFQIYAQMLELRPDVPDCYGQFLPFLVQPKLYENRGNIPAVIRFLCVLVKKVPERLVREGLLLEALTRFSGLLHSKQLDHLGFELVTELYVSVPQEAMGQWMTNVLTVMFQQLANQARKTQKLVRMVVLFLSLVALRTSANALVDMIERVQPNLFQQVWNRTIQPAIGAMATPLSKKLCFAGVVRLLAEADALRQPALHDAWAEGVAELFSAMCGKSGKKSSESAFFEVIRSAASLTSTYEEGYTNCFCPLACAAKEEVDYAAGFPPAEQFFTQWFREGGCKHPAFPRLASKFSSPELLMQFTQTTGVSLQ